MPKNLSQAFFKTASRWLFCFAVIGGYMYYHSAAPLSTIAIAGIGTLALMEIMTYFKVLRGD